MCIRTQWFLIAMASLGILAAGGSHANAQWVPPYNPWGGWGWGGSGFMTGYANVIDAASNVRLKEKEAMMMQEDVNRSRLDTRKQQIDQALYERAVLPTREDERERVQKENLRRTLNDPPLDEIYSAQALNNLAAHIRRLQAGGSMGPDVPLDPEVVRRISVSSGPRGDVGILRDGKLRWPVAIQAHKEPLDSMVQQALKNVASGQQDDVLLANINKEVTKLGDKIDNMPQLTDDINTFTQVRRFFLDLRKSIQVLSQPNAADYFTKFVPQGDSVQQLLDHMNKYGLSFAPAQRGSEGAYVALHRAMVMSATGAQAGGLKVRLGDQAKPAPGN